MVMQGLQVAAHDLVESILLAGKEQASQRVEQGREGWEGESGGSGLGIEEDVALGGERLGGLRCGDELEVGQQSPVVLYFEESGVLLIAEGAVVDE
jgi:hypothetical protein